MPAMESYRGVKFRTVLLDERPAPDPASGELLRWCRVFQEKGFSPPGACAVGNLSCRLERGFLITPAHVPFEDMGAEDLVRVVEVRPEALSVHAVGSREPSSETLLHHAIYARRADVMAVFHGHCQALLRREGELGLPVTPHEVPYGTPELASLAADVAHTADLFLLRNHGFVALGSSLDGAGRRALDALALIEGA